MVEVLHALKGHTWPSSEELGETTMNIGLLQGGQAANALAEACEAVVMFRLIQPAQPVLDVVNMVAERHGCSVEVIVWVPFQIMNSATSHPGNKRSCRDIVRLHVDLSSSIVCDF